MRRRCGGVLLRWGVGRWHRTVAPFLRRLARDYVARQPGLDDSALGAVIARWGARLSAIMIRGNAAIVQEGGVECTVPPNVDFHDPCPLAHLVPEGDCAYELLVGGEELWSPTHDAG